MKKIILIALSALAAVSFTACSGDAHFKDATQLISIINCNDALVITIPDDYTAMQSDDVLVKDVTPTVISVYHDATGSKRVCTVSGTAHLIRN